MYGIKINSSNNVIGGVNAEDRNIISNSINPSSIGGVNIEINGSSNYIVNNYLGTDRTGIVAIPNSINGIYIANGANGNIIGGNTSSLRNVIAGNTVGLYISSNSNLVKGNYIGIGANGFTTIPNGNAGVAINNGSNNTIGTTTINEGNLIAGNTGSGLLVLSGINNSIRGNKIFGNQGSLITSAGINLNTGNNLKQPANFIGVSGSFLTVYSTNIGDNIDLYLDDPSGTIVAQGKTFVQTQTVPSNGIVNFTTVAASFTAGTEKLTLTASDLVNGTSFFTAFYTNPSINFSTVGSPSAFLTAGTTNNLLYGLQITCSSGTNGAFFQGVSLNTTGTPTFITSDFDNIKVYYSNTNVFSTANFMTVADIKTILTFKTAGLFIPQSESKYLWFTGDVSASAVLGHRILSFYGNSVFPYGNTTSTATPSPLQTIVADNFTVFNTQNTVILGSLAWAISNANANALDFNTISFRIPTTDVNHVGIAPNNYWTIPMNTSTVLDITSPVFISGYSQTGASPNTLPILNGNNAVPKIQITGDGTNPTISLSLGSSGSVIQGLILNGNLAGNGAIEIVAFDCKIQGCFIGTDAFGTTAAVAKNTIGINLQNNATNATIGGTNLADRNVIAGNNTRGVNNLGANNIKVINNYFNLAKDGITPITGHGVGTICLFGGNNAQIGNSPDIEQANIIGGLANIKGIFTNFATNQNRIDGNWIGLNILGNTNNNLTGVDLAGTVGNNTISNNIIAGNTAFGIFITSPSNTIQNNKIGLNKDNAIRANGYGIGIANSGNDNIIQYNTIANNTRGIYAPLGTNNWFFQNSIYGNTQIGIDLVNSATILANDNGDGDFGGGNQQQNYPDNILAKLSGNNNLAVSFSISSDLTTSSTAYPLSVQFFKSDGNNQGQTFLGFASAVYSTPNANYTHTFVAQGVILAVGDKITTLVTDANGNTSEFSPDVTVVLACVQPSITSINISQNTTCSQVLSTDLTVSVSNAGSISTFYDLDYNGDGIYDIFGISLVNNQLIVKNAPILGQTIKNPTIKLTTPNAVECPSNPFAFNALISPQTKSSPKISGISVVEPTTCPKGNGKVTLTFEGTIPENLVFNVDLDGDGIYEQKGIKSNTQNQIVIENLSGGTQIGTTIKTFLLGDECISTFTSANKRFLALAPIQDNIRVSAELAQISPNWATNIVISNAQANLKYNLLDRNSNFITSGSTLENGGTIIFPTGFLQQTTRYLVQAEASNCQKTVVGQTEVEVIEGVGQEDFNILKDIFGKTGGNDYWTKKWDFSQNKEFFGVTFFAGKVTSISLRKNNLIDKFPQSVLQLPKLVSLDVSENKLTFESFEELIPKFLPTFSAVYGLQDKFATAYIQDVAEGELLLITATTAGKDNKYQWLKDGVNIPNATESALKIDVSKLTDEGEYTCYVTNKAAPNLTLIRHIVKVNVFEQVTDDDLAELKAFHDALKGTNWLNRWDFKNKKRVFAWHGIRMKGKKVIDISLPNNNLEGQLNEDMFKKQNGIFSELEHLNLSGNNLSGAIPVNLMTLQKLAYLDLSKNQFKGSISGNLARSASLKTLILSHNQFSAVHSDFGKIIGLRTLFLNNNAFTSVPSEIYNLTSLEVLNLNGNAISSISSNISKLKNLTYLGLADNFLTQLPSQLVLLSDLNELNITNNRIKDLPKGLEKLEKLAILKISGNYFEFDDILPFVFDGGGKSSAQVTYSPQRKIGKEKVIVALTDSRLDLFSESLAKGNVFEWYKNNKKINSVNVVGEKLSIFPVRLIDAGLYSVVITNPNAPQLTLNSYEITVLTNCNSQIQNSKILVKGNTIFCDGEKINTQLSVSVPNPTLYNYQWLQNGNKINGATGNEFTVSEFGVYNIILTNKENCSAVLADVSIKSFPKPNVKISAQSNLLKIENIADPNVEKQWLFNGQPIAGATNETWEARQQGIYALQLTSDK
ncbi:MAG: hypothetical protein EAZ97_00700, partial [Bacteroidetes bacterium]